MNPKRFFFIVIAFLIIVSAARAQPPLQEAWLVKGNSGTDPDKTFLGTTDPQPLIVKTNDMERLRITIPGNVGVGTCIHRHRC